MIHKEKALKLIAIYLYISDLYEKELKYQYQRFSNNANPQFTDIEVLTIYVFVVSQQHYKTVKDIYNFTKDFLLSWFPKLPSYQQFDYRLNKLSAVWQKLSQMLLSSFVPSDCDFNISVVDSFPIVMCKGKNRAGKVAREVADKGYCSTKNLYYFGLKLHNFGFRRKGTIPYPELLVLSPASANDCTIFKQEFDLFIFNKTIFADKIYIDEDFFNDRKQSQNYQVLTPVKLVKGEPECLRKRDKAANDLFSRAVSSVRQPIESFFNWINEKTDIQTASKVRSTASLLVHVFAKIVAAFIYLIF
ncbi:MAG: transposase [Prevotellaceae bacterium]|jgi:hypothetical protein|nr:transposase [Prevotellaceae bacterium]